MHAAHEERECLAGASASNKASHRLGAHIRQISDRRSTAALFLISTTTQIGCSSRSYDCDPCAGEGASAGWRTFGPTRRTTAEGRSAPVGRSALGRASKTDPPPGKENPPRGRVLLSFDWLMLPPSSGGKSRQAETEQGKGAGFGHLRNRHAAQNESRILCRVSLRNIRKCSLSAVG